jgi:hypothetical protein
MWRSGITRRRRHAALVEMVELAERTGNYAAPWRDAPHVFEHFRDEAELLRQLQQDWRSALAGAVYIAIDSGRGDLPEDVTKAFQQVQRRYAGTRAILEAHQDHPAIAGAMRKERALLSCVLGSLTAAPTAA